MYSVDGCTLFARDYCIELGEYMVDANLAFTSRYS